MAEPAQVAVEEGAQIIHPVLEHRQPVDADPEREALPLVGVEPAHLDDPAVDHAAAEQLHPPVPRRVAAAAEHPLAVDQREADVDLDRWLGEREVARPQPPHDVLALEERLEEGLEAST